MREAREKIVLESNNDLMDKTKDITTSKTPPDGQAKTEREQGKEKKMKECGTSFVARASRIMDIEPCPWCLNTMHPGMECAPQPWARDGHWWSR